MPNMTGPEIDELLAQPLTAQLVTLRPSGMPHLVLQRRFLEKAHCCFLS